MTPEDLGAVQASWEDFSGAREQLLGALTRHFDTVSSSPAAAAQRADFLFRAVEDLVGLLSAPSRLAVRARHLGTTWPESRSAPSFAIEGRAWLRAAEECIAGWSADLETSWRQAWLLLSDVLAAEVLSPFADEPQLP